MVIAHLNARNIPHEVEALVNGWWVDILSGNTIIEVDGAAWHTNHPLHGEDRAGRDALRDMALIAAGYRVIHLSEAAIRDGSALATLEASL
jgi:very-short-patch-repair endonuclease